MPDCLKTHRGELFAVHIENLSIPSKELLSSGKEIPSSRKHPHTSIQGQKAFPDLTNIIPGESQDHQNIIPGESQDHQNIIPGESQDHQNIIPGESQDHQNIIPGESQDHLDNCDSMVEHPNSKTIWSKLSDFCKNCNVLENGETNPDKQFSQLKLNEELPKSRTQKKIKTTRKRKSYTNSGSLSKNSELDRKKAKDPDKYRPPNWPTKKYVPAINDLPEYRNYCLSIQKKIAKNHQRK